MIILHSLLDACLNVKAVISTGDQNPAQYLSPLLLQPQFVKRLNFSKLYLLMV